MRNPFTARKKDGGNASAAAAGCAPGAALSDTESREWLRALRGPSAAHDEAVRRLHALLLRAARFEVERRKPALAHLRDQELDDIAREAAENAQVSVLGSLDDFHGASRFSTWAAKYALLEAAVKLRRRSWEGREKPLAPDRWAPLRVAPPTPDDGEGAGRGPLLEGLRLAICESLTPHQQEVFTALALEGVPIDVLAESLGSTRGALYETLHGARHTLRDRLTASGIASAPDLLERLPG